MIKKKILKDYNDKKKLILKYNHNYFNLDSPLVPDSTYDKIKNELVRFEKNYPFLKKKGSIQDKIGAPLTKNLGK